MIMKKSRDLIKIEKIPICISVKQLIIVVMHACQIDMVPITYMIPHMGK